MFAWFTLPFTCIDLLLLLTYSPDVCEGFCGQNKIHQRKLVVKHF